MANNSFFTSGPIPDRQYDVQDLVAKLSQADDSIVAYNKQALGSHADAPLVDGYGDPVEQGAFYFNTIDKEVKVYTGTVWQPWGAESADAALTKYKAAGLGAISRTVQDKLRESVSLKDFGAVGDGVADDTAAIQAWWKFAQEQSAKYTNIDSGGAQLNVAVLRLNGGVYNYNGPALKNDVNVSLPIAIFSDGPKAARINIKSNDYFIDAYACRNFFAHNLETVGGKGFVKWSWTGALVGERYVFEHCRFLNYTEAAIVSLSTDHPSLKVKHCDFYGNGTALFGVAWNGYCDEVVIEENNFTGHKYHVKLGSDRTGTSGNWKIKRNGFFTGGANNWKASDIWIVPRSTYINSGFGGIIEDNKFGVEQRTEFSDQLTPRILVAFEDQATGTDYTNYRHSDTNTTGYCVGVTVTKNNFAAASGETRGVIYSVCAKLSWQYYGNIEQGGLHPYAVEYAAAVTTLFDSNDPANNLYIGMTAQAGDNTGMLSLTKPPSASNRAEACIVENFRGKFSASDSFITLPGGSQDIGYTLLKAAHGKDMGLSYGSNTPVPIADPYGSNTAVRFTAVASNQGMRVLLPSGVFVPYLPIWIEIDLRKAAVNGLDYTAIEVNRIAPGYSIGKVYPIKLQTKWTTYKICVDWKDIAGSDMAVYITTEHYGTGQFVAGTKDSIDHGNIRVYQARAPHDGKLPGVKMLGDADFVATVDTCQREMLASTALTAIRNITLSTANALIGDRFRVVRTGGGAFNLTVNGSLAALAQNQWAEFVFASGAWVRVGSGSV